ncbi:MAG: ATP-binding cassette domain-containing protein [Pseudomonadota bacterium]
MPEPILEIRSVVKRFGGLSAVDCVSFCVIDGELLGIAGPNGSGKSTLFNVISRNPYPATSGEVHFRGNRIDQWPAQKIAEAGLTRTFQKDAAFPDLTAIETVALAAHYGKGLARKDAAEAAARTLDEMGVAPERRELPTNALSVYERKQLMIGSALVTEPLILMLDEPASGLTRPEIESLKTLLLQIKSTGVTIILIEHVLSLLLAVAERLIVLNQGRVLAEGEPQTVIRNPEVIEAYLGERAA